MEAYPDQFVEKIVCCLLLHVQLHPLGKLWVGEQTVRIGELALTRHDLAFPIGGGNSARREQQEQKTQLSQHRFTHTGSSSNDSLQRFAQLSNVRNRGRMRHADILHERHQLAVVKGVIGDRYVERLRHQHAHVVGVQLRVGLFRLARVVHGQELDLAERVKLG